MAAVSGTALLGQAEFHRDTPARKNRMNVIIAAFLLKARDVSGSSSKVGLEPRGDNVLQTASIDKLADYMYPWAESMRQLPTPCYNDAQGIPFPIGSRPQGVVLHDGLPAELRANYPYLDFYQYEAQGRESAWTQRFRMLKQFLDGQPEVERMFFTDINDMGIFCDPFHWWDQYNVDPTMLVVGQEWLKFGENKWFTSRYPQFPPFLREYFEDDLQHCLACAAGLWGARRDVALSILNEMLALLDQYKDHFAKYPETSWDMMTFNYVVYRRGPFAAFRMDRTATQGGIYIQNQPNPFTHDRRKVMAFLRGS